MKQVILGAPHWFLIRGEAWGGAAATAGCCYGSEPVPVANSRYGHPVSAAANSFNHVMIELKRSTKQSCHRDDLNYGQRSRLTGMLPSSATRLPTAPAERCSNLSSNDAQTATLNSLPSSATSKNYHQVAIDNVDISAKRIAGRNRRGTNLCPIA